MSRDRFIELQTQGRSSRRDNSNSGSTLNDGRDFYSQMEQINQYIDRIDRNIDSIARRHERALVGVSQDEIKRATRELDDLQDETNGYMDRVRSMLAQLAQETKRMRGVEVQSRQSQQNSAARRLLDCGRKYGKVQEKYKDKYKQKMVRELRIARPDASPQEIDRAVESGHGDVFAQEMLSSRIGEQRRVLQEVQGRHDEILKIEQSVEQLATLFQDMQVLLEQQQEQINIVETHVEESTRYMEEGGKEISTAIQIRQSSRKKLWWILAIVLVILVGIGIYLYLNCSGLGICQAKK
ncbi:t-SNARE [Gorgonomyces haynaldii]|nr:t-SNARE [Gorgonomyces haynaldii]